MNLKINILKLVLFLVFFIVLGEGEFYGQSTKALKKKEARLKKQIKHTEDLIAKTKKSQNATLSELQIINNQILYREALLNNLNSQNDQIALDIENNKKEVVLLLSELAKLRKEFRQMIRFAYKNRNKDFGVLYLLASKDFNEGYKRMKYIHQYSDNRKLQAKEIKNTQEKLILENELLIKNQEDKLLVIEESKKEKAVFINDKAHQQQVLTRINNNQNTLALKLKKQIDEKNKISRAIKAAIKKELAKKKKKTTKGTPKKYKPSPEVAILGKKFAQNKGKLPWPVTKGTITGNYGRQQHSVVSTAFIDNNGVDISTAKNAQVRVVFDGVVSSILNIPGSGKAVIVSHGDYRTVYANLKDVNVKTGQKLVTKQQVGSLLPNTSGAISESHFEIWKIKGDDMKTVNPASWLVRK